MKVIDTTDKPKLTPVFIPTHLLDTKAHFNSSNCGNWESINPTKNNWLANSGWVKHIQTISKISDNIVVVCWKKQCDDISDTIHHQTSVYKGELKYI